MYVKSDMRKVKKLPQAAFWGEQFSQKCVIQDCFQFMTKGSSSTSAQCTWYSKKQQINKRRPNVSDASKAANVVG